MRILVCLLLACASAPAYADAFNLEQVEQEAADFLSAYIQIDTTNPPGNETAAARFLAERFRKEQIEAQVFESAPGRGSILARLKGTGGGRPIILLNHLDVVPATTEGWDVPPFSGDVRGGYVYGRGALDCKGVGTIAAMAMFLIRRNDFPMKRDVIFLGTADEETGGKLGAGWMVANHLDLFRDAEFVLNEGGEIRLLPDGGRVYEVAVSEKTPCWLKLTATGEAGHGASPPPETAVTRLVRALERIDAQPSAVRVTPEVQTYFAALAPMHTDDRRTRYKDLRSALADAQFRKTFLEDRHNAALVRNTFTPTVLTASPKTNVIPRTASAEVDCRLLPGENPTAFVEGIKRTINDPNVGVDVLLSFPPSSSPTDTKLYTVLEKLADSEQSRVVPSVLTGFTDSHYFRDRGMVSYGFAPFALTHDESRREHGINERLSTENLREGIKQLFVILRALGDEAVAVPPPSQ